MAKKKIEKKSKEIDDDICMAEKFLNQKEKITNEEFEKALEEAISSKWYGPYGSIDPMYFFDGFDLFEKYAEKDDLNEFNSIKKKLRNFEWNYPSDKIKGIAHSHLELIIDLEHFNDILNYIEQEGNMLLSPNFLNKKIDLEFIRKGIRIPLNTIKDYWKMYDKKMVEIQNKKLEQIEKLDDTQLSELCLNILKRIIGGFVEKSNSEYLVNLMNSYNLFKGDVKEQQNRQFGEPEEIEIEEFDDEEELEEALEEIEDLEEEEELEEDI